MPELTEDRLLEDLRRYGAAVEDTSGRFGAPVIDYPVGGAPAGPRSRRRRRTGDERSSDPATRAVTTVLAGARPHGPPRRRTAALLAAVAAVVLAIVTGLVVTRGTEGSAPAVDTPAPSPASTTSPDGPRQTLGTLPAATDVVAATPFEDGTVLMWLPYTGLPQYLGQEADNPVSLDVGPAERAGCCDGIATMATLAGFIADGTLHTVDRTGGVVDTGVAGEQVVADPGAGAFYVIDGQDIARYRVSMPTGVDGRWTLPEGWEVPTHSSHSEVLDGRVILERSDRARADHEIAVWTPATGDLRPIGRARWVIDATMAPDGRPRVAWVNDQCDASGAGCDLVVTDLDTMENRVAARPAHGVIGGGAFAPDGRNLAVFVAGQANMGLNPTAALQVVDLDTMDLRVLPDTTVTVGEPFGSAVWTLDGGSVIYHGGGATRVVDIETGEQRTLPWDITYSMATIP